MHGNCASTAISNQSQTPRPGDPGRYPEKSDTLLKVPMLRTIRLLWHKHTPVEKAIFDSVSPLLSPHAKTIYDQQVAAINKVQRYLEWTEINFYRIVRGKSDWSDIAQFPRSEEFTLAKTTYHVDNTKFTTRIHCVAGHIFSFVPRPSVKRHCFGTPEQIQTQILTDPIGAAGEDLSDIPLPESFRNWHNDPTVDTNEWCVLQPHETYVVHLPKSDFVILATRSGDEYLMAKATGNGGNLYYASGDETVVDLFGSFGDIVSRKALP